MLRNQSLSTEHELEQTKTTLDVKEVAAKCRRIFGLQSDYDLELFLTSYSYLLDGLQEKLIRLQATVNTLIQERRISHAILLREDNMDEVQTASEQADKAAEELFRLLSLEEPPPSLCAVLISSFNETENPAREDLRADDFSELSAWVKTLAPDELSCFVKTDSTVSKLISAIRQSKTPSFEDLETLTQEVDFLRWIKLSDLAKEMKYQRLMPILTSELFDQVVSQDFLLHLALELDSFESLPDGYMVTRVIHSMNHGVDTDLELRILVAQIKQVRELGEDRIERAKTNIHHTCKLLAEKIHTLITQKVSETDAQDLEPSIRSIFDDLVERLQQTLVSMVSSGIQEVSRLDAFVEQTKRQMVGVRGSISAGSGTNHSELSTPSHYPELIMQKSGLSTATDADQNRGLIQIQSQIINKLAELIPEFFGGLGRYSLYDQRTVSQLEESLDLFFRHLNRATADRTSVCTSVIETLSNSDVQRIIVEHLAGKIVAETLNETEIQSLAHRFVLMVDSLLLDDNQPIKIDENVLCTRLFGSNEQAN